MASNPTTRRRYGTTEQFAQSINVEPRTVLKQVSKTGHYFGVRPIKGPNRLWYWPDDAADQFFLNAGEPLNAKPPKSALVADDSAKNCPTDQKPESGTPKRPRTAKAKQPVEAV